VGPDAAYPSGCGSVERAIALRAPGIAETLPDPILQYLYALPSSAAVQTFMTDRAQRDQVVLGIVPGSAAELFMMDLKISKAPAGLTSPSIPVQDRPTELLVRSGRKPQAGMFGPNRIHEARWEICDIHSFTANIPETPPHLSSLVLF